METVFNNEKEMQVYLVNHKKELETRIAAILRVKDVEYIQIEYPLYDSMKGTYKRVDMMFVTSDGDPVCVELKYPYANKNAASQVQKYRLLTDKYLKANRLQGNPKGIIIAPKISDPLAKLVTQTDDIYACDMQGWVCGKEYPKEPTNIFKRYQQGGFVKGKKVIPWYLGRRA